MVTVFHPVVFINLFLKLGYFENYRSGYDKVWLRNLKNKKQYIFYENKMSSINYMNNISGKNLLSIFKKYFIIHLRA